jgi:hypothetical protein
VKALYGTVPAIWLMAGLALGAEPAMPSAAEWRFTVLLDGRAIGSHRLLLATADGRTADLKSEARFDVTWLGVPLYRYRRSASEHWQGSCVESIRRVVRLPLSVARKSRCVGRPSSPRVNRDAKGQ